MWDLAVTLESHLIDVHPEKGFGIYQERYAPFSFEYDQHCPGCLAAFIPIAKLNYKSSIGFSIIYYHTMGFYLRQYGHAYMGTSMH